MSQRRRLQGCGRRKSRHIRATKYPSSLAPGCPKVSRRCARAPHRQGPYGPISTQVGDSAASLRAVARNPSLLIGASINDGGVPAFQIVHPFVLLPCRLFRPAPPQPFGGICKPGETNSRKPNCRVGTKPQHGDELSAGVTQNPASRSISTSTVSTSSSSSTTRTCSVMVCLPVCRTQLNASAERWVCCINSMAGKSVSYPLSLGAAVALYRMRRAGC